jgi:hypothetical protein
MTHILESFGPAPTAFRPRTLTDLFGLRLAQKLVDTPAVRHYTALAGQYGQAQLLSAYRRALKHTSEETLAVCFHDELKLSQSATASRHTVDLTAVRVERRSVAVAVFHGDHLEYSQVRQLSSSHTKAVGSAVGFVNWVVTHFAAESVAMESVDGGCEIKRWSLSEAICQTLRDCLLPIWRIEKADLLSGCGAPPLKSRKELREVVTAIWPILSGGGAKLFAQDAAALGLHVQTERLFFK